jgi:D-serine deaminase-like pyridoxal phosphate-dependent protein
MIIKEHCRRKRGQGKAPMNALGHCRAKAPTIVWGVGDQVGTSIRTNRAERLDKTPWDLVVARSPQKRCGVAIEADRRALSVNPQQRVWMDDFSDVLTETGFS